MCTLGEELRFAVVIEAEICNKFEEDSSQIHEHEGSLAASSSMANQGTILDGFARWVLSINYFHKNMEEHI